MIFSVQKHPLIMTAFVLALAAQSAQAAGADLVPPPPPQASVAPAAAVASEAAPVSATPSMTIGNGQPMTIQKLGIAITPLAGWEIAEASQGMSLVMQEPKAPAPVLHPGQAPAISFRRAITVTSFNESYALNAGEAQKWVQRLQEIMGKGAGVSQLTINPDYKFFNYRKTNDGLVIYGQYLANNIPMTQVNVIIPGPNKAYLVTYSDMQSRFDSQPQFFSEAWGSMVSIDVSGEADWRYANEVQYAAIGGGVLLFGLAALIFRRRRARRFLDGFQNFADDSFSSDFSSMSSLSELSSLSPLSEIAHKPAKKMKKAKKDQFQSDIELIEQKPMRPAAPKAPSKVDSEQSISNVAASIHSGIWQLELDQDQDLNVSGVSHF